MPKTKQAAHASVSEGQLEVWLWHSTQAHKPAMICAQLGPFGGCGLRASVQAPPEFMRFASSMETKTGRVKWELYHHEQKVLAGPMLDNLDSPIGRRGPSKAILHIISQDLIVR